MGVLGLGGPTAIDQSLLGMNRYMLTSFGSMPGTETIYAYKLVQNRRERGVDYAPSMINKCLYDK